MKRIVAWLVYYTGMALALVMKVAIFATFAFITFMLGWRIVIPALATIAALFGIFILLFEAFDWAERNK